MKMNFYVFSIFIIYMSALFKLNTSQNETTDSLTTTTHATTTIPTTTTTPSLPTTSAGPLFCTCDLKIDKCDVDCCCDVDCTDDDLLAFPCNNTPMSYAQETCIQSIFRSNLYGSNEIAVTTSANQFCVSVDVYDQENYYTSPQTVTSENVFDQTLNTYKGYSYVPPSSNATVNTTQFYQSGDPILIWYSNSNSNLSTVGLLSVPLTSGPCLDGPVAYLFDANVTCQVSASVGLSNPAFKASNYYAEFKIVDNPQNFVNGSSPLTIGSNNLIQITPRCINSADAVVPCLDPSGSNTGPWTNIVTKVNYTIIYSGTSGIIGSNVTLTLGNITTVTSQISMTFVVQFFQANQNGVKYLRSGNPGYLVDLPVITAINQSNLCNPASKNWMTILSATGDGKCTSGVNREPVNFGVNMQSGCMLMYSYNMTDGSDACNKTYSYIYNLLVGSSPPEFVATAGNISNSACSDSRYWLPILHQPQVSSLAESALNCSNLLVGLNIRIVYANTGAITNPQPYILGVQYEYVTQSLPLKFYCLGSHCPSNSTTGLLLTSSVSFVDASSPTVGTFGAIPTRNVTRTAQDFFYSFS